MIHKRSPKRSLLVFIFGLTIIGALFSVFNVWSNSRERTQKSLEGKRYIEQLSEKLNAMTNAEKIDNLVLDTCRKGKQSIKNSDPFKLSCTFKILDFYGFTSYQDVAPYLLSLEEQLYASGWSANSPVTLKSLFSNNDLKDIRKEIGYNLNNDAGLIDFGFNTSLSGQDLVPLYGVPNIFETDSQDKISLIAAKARESYPYLLVIYWNKEYLRKNF